MTSFNPSIFREYDIRGVADRDLDDSTVRALGIAIAELAQASIAAGGDPPVDPMPTIAVGRDPRLHSPRLFASLCQGIRTGARVIDVGMVPSPVLYFAAHHLATTIAVMITGSHNPAEDNGFKLMRGTASLHGADIVSIRERVRELLSASTEKPPTADASVRDVTAAYVDHAVSQLRLGPRRMKVVVDAGNGAGGPTAVALLQRLGFEVVPLYCEPDGRFPNHHPDPTQPENLVGLQRKVAECGAEVGLALDGDADRLGAIDATGRILWGDQLMILLGRAILEELPGARFVGEVKCSAAMYQQLEAAGGRVEMWKVGHSLIKARMKETAAALAGEMSGHLFFSHRYLGFDDAIYAGARLLELLSRQNRTLAELASELPIMVNTPEIRLDCPDAIKFAVVATVARRLREDPRVRAVVDIDGVRASFDGGWGLVRASNTQAALVMRCEADVPAKLDTIRTALEEEIAHARKAAGSP